MIPFNLTLQSEKVILRPLRMDDYDALRTATQDTDIWTYFTMDLSDAEELRQWLQQSVEAIEQQNRLAFLVMDAQSKAVIGSTSLGNISERDKRLEIGWTWLAPAYQGKGYNAEVKHLLLWFCFETAGALRVESKTDVLNETARKALLNSGFTAEGVLRSHTEMTNNRRRDTIYYSILQSEWEGVKNKRFTQVLADH